MGGLAGGGAGCGSSPEFSFLPVGKGGLQRPCGPTGGLLPTCTSLAGGLPKHQTPRLCSLPLCRKCKLVTSGPWLEVAPIALGDVSIIPESPGADRSGHIALWAVSDKGDVLCRLGVSELNPAVSTLPPGKGATGPTHLSGPRPS